MTKLAAFELFLVIMSSSCVFGLDRESVPVLIWNDERPPLDMPAVSAVPIQISHLERKYLEPFNPSNILLFLQDTLSVEDLSGHENVFKHVSKYMEDSHSLYLPAVETKGSIRHIFSAQGYNTVILEPGSAIGELKLKEDTKNLVIVVLPSTITNSSRQKSLQKSDEVIRNCISMVGKQAKFTVIFTGEQPSVKSENDVEHRRVTRAVKQDANDTNYFNTDCIILYLRDNLAYKKGNDSTNYFVLPNSEIDKPPVSDCQQSHNSIVLSYKNLNELDKIKITLNFTGTNGRWTLDSAEIAEGKGSEVAKTAMLQPVWPMDNVPVKMSFSCSETFILSSLETPGQDTYKLKIQGMQVEAFADKRIAFSTSWDCVGFFTIPIWMGIFAGIILTLILLVGMYMLSQIKTMDRFDDPKGKHLMVFSTSD